MTMPHSSLNEIDSSPFSEDLLELEEDFRHLEKAELLMAIDHGRAGNSFFKRVFDPHSEILTIPFCSYFYHDLARIFNKKERIPWSEAVESVMNETNFPLIAAERSLEIDETVATFGDDPNSPIERAKIAGIFSVILKRKKSVTRKDILIAIHVAYAHGINRPVKKYRFILLDDSVTSSQDKKILDDVKKDFTSYKIIHLVRDPRATFSSLRHQIVNQFGSMYPLKAPVLWKSVGSNAVWLWVIAYTTAGAKEMHAWSKELGYTRYTQVRNEDCCLDFSRTMRSLTDWLGVSWYAPWEASDYVPTSNGYPWKGLSAYSSKFKRNTNGPFENDNGEARHPEPSRQNVERWKNRLLKSEINFLEGIYYDEMQDLGYPFQFVRSPRDAHKAIGWAFLPLSGELPGWKWISRIRKHYLLKDLIIRLTYYPLLPIFYVLSRMMLLILFYTGRLKTRLST